MEYVLIYEDTDRQIKDEVVTGSASDRIRQIESSGGYFLRLMKKETFDQMKAKRRRGAAWND